VAARSGITGSKHALVRIECGVEAPPDAVGWRAYVVGVRDEMDDDEYVTTARSALRGSSAAPECIRLVFDVESRVHGMAIRHPRGS
jgi:hypothetical protein